MMSQSKCREAQNNPIIHRRRSAYVVHGSMNDIDTEKTSGTSSGSRVWVNHQYMPHRDMRGLRTHVFANFRWSCRGLVNSFLPRYARSRWLRAVLETIMDYGRRSLARLVVGYTGGKEGFRTRWKIYGGAVDKLCFISRDVIFIKAAGRCLLPPYTPVVGGSYRALCTACTSRNVLCCVRIQLFIPPYTDTRACRINSTLMDLLKLLEIDFCTKDIYRVWITSCACIFVCVEDINLKTCR